MNHEFFIVLNTGRKNKSHSKLSILALVSMKKHKILVLGMGPEMGFILPPSIQTYEKIMIIEGSQLFLDGLYFFDFLFLLQN